MKKPISIVLLLIACTYNSGCKNQNPTAILVNLPSFQVLLLDSSTLINSNKIPIGKPSIFIYFNTDCSHCRQETKILLQHINSLKNSHIYFVTQAPLEELKKYNNDFHLTDYKNITVGLDYEYTFAKIFRPQNVPYIAIYNSRKKLVKIYNGNISVEMIYKAIQSEG